MGLFDSVRRLLAGGGDADAGVESGDDTSAGAGSGGDVGTGEGSATPPSDVEFGPVAGSYVETGGPPDDVPDPERDGRANVLVTMAREAGPEGFVDTDDLESYVRSVGGEVEHAHGGGTVSAWMPTDRLADLASGPDVARVEVTIPDAGDVRDDPDFET